MYTMTLTGTLLQYDLRICQKN